MSERVTFVTGNRGKREDFEALLRRHERLAGRFELLDADLPELRGASHASIAEAKCRRAASSLLRPALVEDTALELLALGGMPGPYVKFFWQQLGNRDLPKLLAAFEDKGAVARSVVAYSPGPGAEVRLFHGECRGSLLEAPRIDDCHEDCHGWLPLLVPRGCSLALGEMRQHERFLHYHRAKAFEEFFAFFSETLA